MRIIPADRIASPKSLRAVIAMPLVNIQGDEPLIDPAVVDAVANALNDSECPPPRRPSRRRRLR